eukprot:gene12359-9600_t
MAKSTHRAQPELLWQVVSQLDTADQAESLEWMYALQLRGARRTLDVVRQ